MADLSPTEEDHITTFGLLLEAQAALVRLFDRSLRKNNDLPLRWFEVLIRLARTPGACLPAGELGASVALTSGATTRLIDRLADAGLVGRHADPDDRRVVDICLTDLGRARLNDALPVHLADLRRHFVNQLDPDEMESLARTMRRLRDATADHRA